MFRFLSVIGLWVAVGLLQAPQLFSYFSELVGVESYGWIVPSLVSVTMVGLIGLRWDRNLSLPTTWPAFTATLFGIGAASFSLFTNQVWWSIVGLLGTSLGLLLSHNDKKGRSLARIWPLSLGLVIPPWNTFAEVQSVLASAIAGLASNILSYMNVVHINFGTTVAIPDSRILLDSEVTGLSGWPFFLAVALVYSTICNRPWFVTLTNAIISFAAFIAFHIAYVVVIAYYRDNSLSLPNEMVLRLILAGLAAWIFLSAERGMRGLLQDVPDGSDEGSTVNPIVYIWNRIFAPSVSLTEERGSLNNTVFLGCIGASIMCLALALIFSFGTGSAKPEATWDVPDIAENLMATADSLDHRKVSVWGAKADLWTYYLPDRVTNIVVSRDRNKWTALPSRLRSSGQWESASRN